MKLAFIDLDGVVADSTRRFEQADEAKAAHMQTNLLFPERTEREADKLYWQTAFTPELVDLDTPIPGAVEALEQIEKTYRIMYLSSRPESMRADTEAWLHKNYLAEDVTRSKREIILKAPGFQYVKTVVWKVGMIQQLATLFRAGYVLVVDDEQAIRDAILHAKLNAFETMRFGLLVAGSLPEAVLKLGE